MEYRNLGKAGVKVSTLCLGAMTFGEPNDQSFMHQVATPEADSHALCDRFVAAGGNFIDVADVYGQDGLSEQVLGRWLARDGNRDKVVLATKFRFRMQPGPNGTGASRYRIVKCVEESLRRLQTDRIDLYQVHMQDLDTPEEETLRALDDLVRAGKVVYIGCSNYTGYRLVESVLLSQLHHWAAFVTLQAQYSLVVRDLERELAPACVRHGLGILPWSPLASGFLTGKYRQGQAAPTGSRMATWQKSFANIDKPRNWQILDAVTAIAAAHQTTLTAVSLAWLLQRPAVTSVIFGARNAAQLDENLLAAGLQLTADEVAQLDAASAFEVGYPYEFIARTHKRW